LNISVFSFSDVSAEPFLKSLTYFQVNRSSSRSTDIEFYPRDWSIGAEKNIKCRTTVM